MEFNVEITQEDIQEGIAGVYNECPVARSLKRLGCQNIDADEDRILVTFNDKRYLFKTPRKANHFIDDFDCDREVKPFEFKLEKPRLATVDDERKPLYKKTTWGSDDTE